MKKKLFLSCLLLSTALSLMAKDVLYLKNGSTIKGEVLEMNLVGLVKMQTENGTLLLIYENDQIDKIEKDSDLPQTKPLVNAQPEVRTVVVAANSDEDDDEDKEEVVRRFRVRGYRGFGETSFLFGNGFSCVMLSTSHGVQICPWVFVGGGVGTNFYSGGGESLLSIPIFADVRAYPCGHKRVSPVIGLKTGWSLTDKKDEEGDVYQGLMFQASVGVSVAFKPKFGLYSTFGYNWEGYFKGGGRLDGYFFSIGLNF